MKEYNNNKVHHNIPLIYCIYFREVLDKVR